VFMWVYQVWGGGAASQTRDCASYGIERREQGQKTGLQPSTHTHLLSLPVLQFFPLNC
jgi:hypothetical protein